LTGPLWGEGVVMPQGDAAEFEDAALAAYPELRGALEKVGATMARRSLRIMPRKMSYDWLDDQKLSIRFELPSGAFATTLLAELFELKDDHKMVS
jgi:tRNA pseudouridine13 synthase